MSELKEGSPAPAFTMPTDGGGKISLADLKGSKVVLYFYPKDDTPGCTTESCAFRDAFHEFDKLNTQVIGISKDSPESHDKFKKKFNLNFPLASDTDGKVCEAYGVWQEKSMYGKKYMGIDRSTFLINENGKIERIWRKVKVDGHVDEVKSALTKKAA
jgi:thioredoxin-dependent peroxiredoxin